MNENATAGTSEVKIDNKITIQAARQAIAKERQQRAIDCGKDVNALLKKYNCDLVAIPMINSDGRITAQSQITAKE